MQVEALSKAAEIVNTVGQVCAVGTGQKVVGGAPPGAKALGYKPSIVNPVYVR